MSGIFNTLVRPSQIAHAASRAYLSILAPKTRSDMLKVASEVFFATFPDSEVEDQFSNLLKMYGAGGARRNEIAHGIVAAHATQTKKFTGYFLGPSYSTHNKRNDKLEPRYRYSLTEFELFIADLDTLSNSIKWADEALLSLYRSSPEGPRSRY